MQPISDRVWRVLNCGACGRSLEKTAHGARSLGCGETYTYTADGSLDLRLKHAQKRSLEFDLPAAPPSDLDPSFGSLELNPAPEVGFSAIKVPRHLTKQLLSYFPRAGSADSLALDLGCGDAIHREVCTRAGFEWVGLDRRSHRAPILADAQAIPFGDNAFEFMLCITVLQYVQFPFIALREAFRVLRLHGTLVGTVAFLEPSHGTSFYHPSRLGTYNLLRDAGFTVRQLAPMPDWPVLKALASMGLFYGMPCPMAQALVAPLQWLHRAWWRAGGLLTGRNLESARLRHFAGSFGFVATKDLG